MESKMKITVCFCTRRQLEESEISYNVSNTFHCQCEPNAGFFVVPCEEHTLFKRMFSGRNFVFNCQCYELRPFEYCDNCNQVRYILKFLQIKSVLMRSERLSKKSWLKLRTISKNIKNELFFYFWGRESLDNPNFKEIRNVKNFGN